MASHHTQRFFNLHHDQIAASRIRRLQRQIDRTRRYLAEREEARMEYHCMLVFGFISFAYTMLATALYLDYLLL